MANETLPDKIRKGLQQMIKNSALINNQQTEIVSDNPSVCHLCQQKEGDILFFHDPTQKWFHKRCFEEFTCKNSLMKLME